jgi:hypothetical protein
MTVCVCIYICMCNKTQSESSPCWPLNVLLKLVTTYLNVSPVYKCPLHNISGNFQNESLSILHNLFPFAAAVLLPCLQNHTPILSNVSNA